MPDRNEDPHSEMESRADSPGMGTIQFYYTSSSSLKHPLLGFMFSKSPSLHF